MADFEKYDVVYFVKEKDIKIRDEKEEIRTDIPFLSSSDKTFETNEKILVRNV